MQNYLAHSKELAHLNAIQALLGWDYETLLPAGAVAFRAETMGYLASQLHQKSTSASYEEACEQALAQAQDPIHRKAITQSLKDLRRKKCLPQRLVEELSSCGALAHQAWVIAKREKDFSLFRPHLEKMLNLAREQASCLAQGENPYDALLEEYSPGMTSQAIEALFRKLEPQLKALLQRASTPKRLNWEVSESIQQELCQAVIHWMGFPNENLTLAKAAHPFCSGFHPTDVRITTRYELSDPLSSLMSTVHELGHALYEHQLPTDFPGTGLMQAGGMDLHESQSRFWEVCLATSPAFFRWVHRWFKEHHPKAIAGIGPEDLFRHAASIAPTLIRTEADPVSYGLHIMARFQLEKALFAGNLTVAELPDAWNENYRSLLGLIPPDDGVGVLQDVHWSMAGFGYFPSYLLGTMIACQLHQAMRTNMANLETKIESGDLTAVRQWLKEHVHRFGRGKTTQEILQDTTGEALRTDAFLEFLSLRFIT